MPLWHHPCNTDRKPIAPMARLVQLAVVSLLIGFRACQKHSQSGPDAVGADTSTTTPNLPPATSSKKGACFNNTSTQYGTWNGDIVNLKAFWYYTWETPPGSPAPQNAEFVPMFWGRDNMTSGNISLVQQLKAQGTAKYVLGFNEPDN